MTAEWWHSMVLGIGLVLLELALPAFFVIWFGLGVLIVGVILVAAPTAFLPVQIVVWIAASLAFVFLWFKVFKVHMHRTRVGVSKVRFAGEIGLLTRDIKAFQKGQIRFQKPILGAEAWEAIVVEDIGSGERVQVLAVEGNILRVQRAQK